MDYPNHPLDGEYDNAEMAAAALVLSAKRVGLPEVELPLVDRNAVWAVSARKMGIDGTLETDIPFLDPGEEPEPQSDLP